MIFIACSSIIIILYGKYCVFLVVDSFAHCGKRLMQIIPMIFQASGKLRTK